jgi:hypothetical protein
MALFRQLALSSSPDDILAKEISRLVDRFCLIPERATKIMSWHIAMQSKSKGAIASAHTRGHCQHLVLVWLGATIRELLSAFKTL